MTNTPQITVGTKYQRANNRVWEVRAFVDDDYIVVRTWNTRRDGSGDWIYGVELVDVIKFLLNDGTYKLV